MMANLAKLFSVRLWTNWLWVRVQLQSFNLTNLVKFHQKYSIIKEIATQLTPVFLIFLSLEASFKNVSYSH